MIENMCKGLLTKKPKFHVNHLQIFPKIFIKVFLNFQYFLNFLMLFYYFYYFIANLNLLTIS